MPDLKTIEKQLSQSSTESRKLPPVDQWNPDFCGDLDMQITKDGRWIHEGGEIKRQALVNLFASILWKEGDSYFLKTPVEKVGIQVENVPFFITAVDVQEGQDGQELIFTSSTDDVIKASEANPLRVEIDTVSGEPSPYLLVRFGMEGRLNRNVYYQLADLAEERNGEFGVESCGQWFVIG